MQLHVFCIKVDGINGSVQATFSMESAIARRPSNHVSIDVASQPDNPVVGKRYKITIVEDPEQGD